MANVSVQKVHHIETAPRLRESMKELFVQGDGNLCGTHDSLSGMIYPHTGRIASYQAVGADRRAIGLLHASGGGRRPLNRRALGGVRPLRRELLHS